MAVRSLDPWFEPRHVIPLAGTSVANAMNTVSLASERFAAESAAMRASMISATNALLAVGLVSIPGMLTGQVLAGVDRLVAARYQIMVMAMVYTSAGHSAGWCLASMRPRVAAAAEDAA